MRDVLSLMELLKSESADQRYEACELLRVSPEPLPPAVLEALRRAAGDSNADVADAAGRALRLHTVQPAPEAPMNLEAALSAASTREVRRGSDFVVGLLGWVILHNLYFLLMLFTEALFLSAPVTIVLLLLPFVVVLGIVLWTRRLWIGVGAAAAIFLSTILWLANGLPIIAGLLPFPLGALLMMQ